MHKLDFSVVVAAQSELLMGAVATLALAGQGIVLAMLIGVTGVAAKEFGGPALDRLVSAFVELIRNTPFLVQIFFIFFALPLIGIRLSPTVTAVIALGVNGGAYAIEIIRGGLGAVGKGIKEAGFALGLSNAEVFFFVLLKPTIRAVYPSLVSQFVSLTLTTSIAVSISANELTYVAQTIESQTFKSFEVYLTTAVIYLVISWLVMMSFAAIASLVFRYPTRQDEQMATLTWDKFAFILGGLGWTLILTAISFGVGIAGGFLVALVRVSQNTVIRWTAVAFIAFFQGTPLLLQLFVVYYGLGLLNFNLPASLAVAIAFGLNASAFLGNIWRGGIQAVSLGQTEAAEALGLSYYSRMIDIVLPQALRISLPATIGFLVQLLKGTSLAALVGFIELTRAGQIVSSQIFKPLLVFAIVGALYFLLCWPISLLGAKIEQRQHHQT